MTDMIITDLTLAEALDLDRLEGQIEHGLETFAAIGRALEEIRDRKLYRALHATWDDYCQARWNFTRQHAARLINAYQVVELLSASGAPEVPNEHVARALGAIEDDGKRETVWLAAVQLAGTADKVTASFVRTAQTVIDTAEMTSGYVDTGEGEMTALGAALTQEQIERARRQQEHIRAGRKPPLYNDVMQMRDIAGGELARRLNHVVGEADRKVRIVIYEVEVQS